MGLSNFNAAKKPGELSNCVRPVSSEEEYWERMFQILSEFHKNHGHCLGPRNPAENIFLWKWIEGLRKSKYTLNGDKINRLNELGFAWTQNQILWEKNYVKLLEFNQIYGHCNVPQKFKDGTSLGSWVSAQRAKRENLSEACTEKLNRIGFIWDLKDFKWENRYQQLVEFKNKHGHCDVTPYDSNYRALGLWLRSQRINKGKLDSKSIDKLNSLAIDWNPRESLWEKNFQQLVKFKKEHGHCNVPPHINETESLCRWVRKLRNRKQKLSPKRKKLLDDLGFYWNPFDKTWNESFSKLVKYKSKYGHCNVPENFIDDPSLAGWVARQRSKRNILDDEKKERLNKIGFTWSFGIKKKAC